METDWYKKEDHVILSELGSDRKRGLSTAKALTAKGKYGINAVVGDNKSTAWNIFKRQFENSIVYILVFAATISVMIGKKTEYLVIMCIVGFIVFLSFIEEYKANKDMQSLRKLAPKRARVIRDGTQQEILAVDLVPGDILVLRKGDIVGADARLLEVQDLSIDESTLTGESYAVAKETKSISKTVPLAQRTNMVFASTHISRGNGLAVVVGTGAQTEIGLISTLVKDIKEEETPLQKKLDKLSLQVSLWTIVVSVIIVIIGVIKGEPIGEMALLAIAVAVAGIPESLPTVVVVCLALGMKRMAKSGAIVKRLAAVETLGTCTVICTDKTGTLTQNHMTVERLILPSDVVRVTADPENPQAVFLKNDSVIDHTEDKDISRVLHISLLCNNAQLISNQFDGEPTEIALLQLGAKGGIAKSALHAQYPRVIEHPFDHERKCMSVIHSYAGRKNTVFMKGAPEVVLKKCTSFISRGKLQHMTTKSMRAFHSQYELAASEGMRVLGLAYKLHTSKSTHRDHVESGLTFAGFVAMRDPPHPEVYNAVKQCQDAGIKIVMITGDNPVTAKAIGAELGIYRPGDIILTGDQLDQLSNKELEVKVNLCSLYARTTPKHKLRIVTSLQAANHIVAMTGDGVNDAPALKKADVGVAMGKMGTEVAKEAAEMVIIDDNFATIVSAIREGRCIYANIRKFIYYLLTTTISQVVLILLSTLMGVPAPLTALMILFVNLLTSDFPAIGIALEKPADNIMKQAPRDPREGIINEPLLYKMLHITPLFVLGIILFFMWNLQTQNHTLIEAQTISFVTLTLFCVFHGLNSKSLDQSIFGKQFFSNVPLLISLVFSILATMIVVYWPPAHIVFGTTSLPASDWLPLIFTSAAVIVWVELEKAMINAEVAQRDRAIIRRPEKQ